MLLGEQTYCGGYSRELLKSSKAIEHYFGSQFSYLLIIMTSNYFNLKIKNKISPFNKNIRN